MPPKRPYFTWLCMLIGVFFVYSALQPNHKNMLKPRVKLANKGIRSLAMALESYHADAGEYPAGIRMDDIFGISDYRYLSMELERIPPIPYFVPIELTSPVAYLSSIPSDPWGDPGGRSWPFPYARIGESWILISAGPDWSYQIDPARDLNPDDPTDTSNLIAKTYDPTNGVVSTGDIWRVHQP